MSDDKLQHYLMVSDEYLRVIMDALEVYDRLSGGQVDYAIEALTDSNKMSGLPTHHWDESIEPAVKAWKQMYDERDPRRSRNAATWAQPRPGVEVEDDYYNPALSGRYIRQMIRRYFALKQNPEGGWTTDFDKPMFPHPNEPVPKLVIQAGPKVEEDPDEPKAAWIVSAGYTLDVDYYVTDDEDDAYEQLRSYIEDRDNEGDLEIKPTFEKVYVEWFKKICPHHEHELEEREGRMYCKECDEAGEDPYPTTWEVDYKKLKE